MKKGKKLMVLGMAICLSGFFAGCLGGEGKDETGISEEAVSGFDLTKSFAKLNTKIVSSPPLCSESNSAEFKFKCTGGVLPCKFKCNLDDQGWTKCKKAMTFFGLAQGDHTLQVYAIDATGKKDKTPESYSWTVASFCPSCGDGICSPGENTSNCPADCPSTELAIFISAGGHHTCALTSSGGVKCWGENSAGQLGDGTNSFSWTPVEVSGLSSGVSAISGGGDHTCALNSGGTVKCWGYNVYGQLGNGNYTSSNVPVDVSGLSSGVSAISAGDCHSCALISGGGVKCWGCNYDGELGDGTNTNRNSPVDVFSLSSGIGAISVGGAHTCALTSGGGVKCWGDNLYGQIGDGTNENDRWTPVDVIDLSSGVNAISAGYSHTCALTSGGAIKCWGRNSWGQLGDGTTIERNIPVEVTGLSSGVSAISAGGVHTCALVAGGAVKCWGLNDYGQIGDGTNSYRLTPVDVSGLSSGVSAISAGSQHTCALTLSGGVKCWGSNGSGKLGNGTTVDSNVPVDVIGFGP